MLCPIHIRDHGRALLLDYEQFLEYHDGSALAGAAIGWRAMERAGMALSEDEIWDRGEIAVSARHAGPGVRDALEYVTRCFTRERFQNEPSAGRGGTCASAADFHFTLNDGRKVVRLELLDGVVPESFFAAVRRCREEPESEEARAILSERKVTVAAAVVLMDIRSLFRLKSTALMLQPGQAHA